MNPHMLEFALHLASSDTDIPDLNPLVPYRHWGAPSTGGVPWL
jgi:hypothetical protein